MTWLRRGLRIAVTGVSFAAIVLLLCLFAGSGPGRATMDAAPEGKSSLPDEARAPSTIPTPILSGRDLTAFLSQVNSVNAASQDDVRIPVYAVGEDASAKPQLAVRTCVALPRRATPEERFQAYVQWLGRHVHQGSRIVLVRFDDSGAVVDLQAAPHRVGGCVLDYWHERFQGSAGGSHAETELSLNLTQPGVKVEWPRQVEVRYQGGPCEFDHAPGLATAIRRDAMWDRLAAWHSSR